MRVEDKPFAGTAALAPAIEEVAVRAAIEAGASTAVGGAPMAALR
ncbi:hypothetical protein [Actinophytocola algeriensis]|uniref:Uncharacterized protein n=1 Tax=Actinophytocola algeriensis TaxID=1768010 RepID=A0A7W7QET3_9PSEU|nr:hypothetical protein [Actinophytocola algeriensis]MBB4912213.1 hypothetical protein [Actinophytocola algeriensis]MBE1474271.1 hypothetical protein [Actinophytocola algeriensis]